MLNFTRKQKIQMLAFKTLDVDAFTLSHIADHFAVGFWLDRVAQVGFTDKRRITAIDALVAACVFRNQVHDVELSVETAEGHLVVITGKEASDVLFILTVDTVDCTVAVLLNDHAIKPETTIQYGIVPLNGKLCIIDGTHTMHDETKLHYHRSPMTGRLLSLSRSRLIGDTYQLSAVEYVRPSYSFIDKVDLEDGMVFAYATQVYASGEVDLVFRYHLAIFNECKDVHHIKRVNGEYQLLPSGDDPQPIACVLETGDSMKLELGKNVLEIETI